MRKILAMILAAGFCLGAAACAVSDSEGRGFESLRAGQKIPHEIAVFRLFRAVFVLLEILQNTLKYRNISQKCKSTCKSISNLAPKNILYKFRFLLDFI